MLFAVASRDGKEINEHFGQAERFLIFEVNGTDVLFDAEKRVDRYCSNEPDHSRRRPVIEAIAGKLKGCRALVCSQIGPSPQMELDRLGIEVFTAEGPIERVLIELAKVL
jgi:predicted Fe-Mo cluster-binding NifX family protein